MTRQELRKKLLALQSGDNAAFEEIYEHLKTPMYTIILRITQDHALSEDILQEVFLKLYQSPPKPPIEKPRAYLFQTARNLAIDSMRKRSRLIDMESIEQRHIYLPADDNTLRMDVDHAINALPLQERQIVSLHINGELTFREVAGMLDIPLGTALWKYQKAIKRLRSNLSGGITG